MRLATTLSPFVVLATLWCPAAYAQEEEQDLVKDNSRRSLAERVPAVSGRFFRKEGRAELTPSVNLSLNDPFYTHVPFGLNVSFHLFESLSFGVSGEYYASIRTPVQVSGGGSEDPPKYNRPTFALRFAVQWAPLYGKVSLMAESVLHFDTYLEAAVGAVGPLRTKITPAWGGAVGQRYFLNEWTAVRLELRLQFFSMARQPKKHPGKRLQTLVTMGLGFSFFLPTDFEREKL